MMPCNRKVDIVDGMWYNSGIMKMIRKDIKLKVVDWDIDVDRRFIRPYLGSHRLYDSDSDVDLDSADEVCWGRDFYFQFLGLHLYLAIAWR